MQLHQDFATGARFAAAAVAGDQADAAQVEQMREPDVELATRGGGKEILGRDLGTERMLREGEVFAVHRQKSSSSLRNRRPGRG